MYLFLYIQSAIALVAAFVLITFPYWPFLKEVSVKKHMKIIIVALVDFHKHQCYFASTIQIAALVLYRRSQNALIEASERKIASNFAYDTRDRAILEVLAYTALLPISLTLCCIARWGRQSWYLTLISSVTIVLGTTTLAAATRYGNEATSRRNRLIYRPQDISNSKYSYYEGTGNEIFKALCGPRYLHDMRGLAARPVNLNWFLWLDTLLAL